MDLSKVPGGVHAAMDRGNWEGSLDAYRDFFMQRSPRSPPMSRAIRASGRGSLLSLRKAYLHTAEDLMNNRGLFGMIDMPCTGHQNVAGLLRPLQ